MKALLFLAVLSQVSGWGVGGNPAGPNGKGRAGGIANRPLFAAFRPTGKGMPATAPNICDTLTPAEKTGEYWCINGATPDSASTVTMTRQGTAFEEVTVKQCSGAPNCFDMVGLRATSTQGGGSGPFFRSDVLSGRDGTTTAPFTACAWTRHSAFENMFIGLGNDDGTASIRYRMGSIGVRTQYFDISNTTCGSSPARVSTWGSTTPWTTDSMGVQDGAPILVCARYDGTTAVHRNTYASPSGSAIGAHCAGGNNARFLYGGFTAPQIDGTFLTGDAYLFGGFHVSTALSDARIAEISAAMFSNTIRSEGGTAMSNARTLEMFCPSEDGNSLTILPAGMTCATSGGIYKRRASTNYWTTSYYLSGNGHGIVSATSTNNAGMSPTGVKDATRINFNGVGSYIWRPYYSGTCPSGPSVLSFYVKGVSSSGSIRASVSQLGSGALDACTLPCSYTSSGWTRCKFAVNNTRTDNVFQIGQFYSGSGTNCSTHTTESATSIYMWGIQCEADIGGGLATPLIQNSGANRTHQADKPKFDVGAAATSPIAVRAKWVSPPVPVSLGDMANNTGFATYLLSLSNSGTVRNFLRFLGYTAEYSDGSSGGAIAASDLTTQEGTIMFRGSTTAGQYSAMTMGAESSDVQGSGTTQTWNTVEVGWSSTSLNFDGVIKDICVGKKPTDCQ